MGRSCDVVPCFRNFNISKQLKAQMSWHSEAPWKMKQELYRSENPRIIETIQLKNCRLCDAGSSLETPVAISQGSSMVAPNDMCGVAFKRGSKTYFNLISPTLKTLSHFPSLTLYQDHQFKMPEVKRNPPFRAEHLGSLLRPKELLTKRGAFEKNELSQ